MVRVYGSLIRLTDKLYVIGHASICVDHNPMNLRNSQCELSYMGHDRTMVGASLSLNNCIHSDRRVELQTKYNII